MKTSVLINLLSLLTCMGQHQAGENPVASWGFEEGQGSITTDSAGNHKDELRGHLFFAPGVRGSGLKFDGFTSRVVRKAAESPRLTKAFTVEAWIAPQEYSWSWTGIVDHDQDAQAGYFLGINHLGQIGFHASVDGRWQGCVSKEPVPLLKWSHVAGTFDPQRGFSVFVNGQLAGRQAARGKFKPADNLDLLIGMSHRKQYPAGSEREPSKRFFSAMVFDGLIDEVRIFNRALTAEEIKTSFAANTPANLQPLQYRRIPTGPEGPGRFGAYYTRLKYCPEWDRLWRVADKPDIVVQFDESPTKLIFWRGTGHIPFWAAENGVCVADEGVETSNAWGCCEAMSDKQCRYSHVRIIESTPARAVVHWRTASPDIRYESANVNPDTGWRDWTDEYFYTYPDGVSVRYQLVHSDAVKGWMEFQQTQVLNQPGTRPQDNLEAEAITVLNMKGGIGSHIWDKPYGRSVKAIADANIQVTNLKARNRHYVIGEEGSHWEPFSFGAPPWTFFSCWNHWPVAQLPNDGRIAAAPDRPSSTCCGTLYPVLHKLDNATAELRDLYGMTDKPVTTLVTLARSWNFPAELVLSGEGYTSNGYDKNQRAYVLACKQPGKPTALKLTLAGSQKSPVFNPALVIKNWGEVAPTINIDSVAVPGGERFRFGHVATLEGTDLVCWIKLEAMGPVGLCLLPDGLPMVKDSANPILPSTTPVGHQGRQSLTKPHSFLTPLTFSTP